MNKNILTIGMIVGAIASISSPINAQSVVENRLWLAQSERNSSPSSSNADSQGCVYEEKGAAGSGGKPTKICRNPQVNGIRIDACLFAYGSCNTKASAEEFCRSQGDGYTEYYNDKGVNPNDRPSQTISITNGKIHSSKNTGNAPFSYKIVNSSGRLVAFSYIRCRNPQSIANNKPKKDRSAANQPDRPNNKKKAPLFKGALDLAANRQFTISVPVGNGQRQDVVIRVNESGQLIDPLTNQVAVPAKQSTGRNTLGTQILNNMLSKTKININKLKNSTEFERLNYSVYAFEKAGNTLDAVEIIIESRLRKPPNINVSSMVEIH